MSAPMDPAMLEQLLNGPSMKPPPGVTPTFDDPPSLRAASYAVTIVFLVLATVATGCRVFTKARIMRSFDREDYVAVASYVVFVAWMVPIFMMWEQAPGYHLWDVQLKDLKSWLYHLLIAAIMYSPAILFIKISILLQIIHIFSPLGTRNRIWYASYALMGVNIAFYFSTFVVAFVTCRPLAKNYDPLVTEGQCLSFNGVNITTAVFNTVSDLIILLLPQRSIWRLHATFGRRLGVSVLFLAGLASVAASVCKWVYVTKVALDPDSTFWYTKAVLSGVAEVALGIVVAALPCMPKFFQSCRAAAVGVGSSLLSLSKMQGGGSGAYGMSGSGSGSKEGHGGGGNDAGSEGDGRSSKSGREGLLGKEEGIVPPVPVSVPTHAYAERTKRGDLEQG